MKVRLNCSDKLNDKLMTALEQLGMVAAEDASVVLVEQGYEMIDGRINIVFEPMDYMDVLMLINKGIDLDVNPSTLIGMASDRFVMLPVEEIEYIEVSGGEVVCKMAENVYRLKQKLSNYETMLSEQRFIRINKSQLVNLMKVKEIIPWFNSRLVLRLHSEEELEVSKIYAKALRQLLNL